MDEQRLERALRAGPPFATAYVARPLPLGTRPYTAGWGLALPRIAVVLAVLGLLLAATIVGVLLSGLVPSPAAVVIRDPGPERSYTISIVRSDGREETIFPQGTRGPVWIDDLAWSADGQELAFTALPRKTTGNDIVSLYVMRSDGSDLRALTTIPGHGCPWSSAGNMRWAPDGSAIAVCYQHEFGTRPATTDRDMRTELAAVDLASGASTILATDDDPLEYFGPFRWSPDSRWLAYRTQMSGNALWAVRRDGSSSQQLSSPAASAPADGPVELAAFAWSPQSDAIAFGRPGGAAIEIVRLDGAQSFIDLPSAERNDTASQVLAWNGVGELIYLAAGGRVVAMTSVDGTTGEVLLSWGATDAPGWLSPDGRIDWSRAPWVSPDGRTLNWWESGDQGTCLVAAAGGEVEQEFCIDTGSAAGRDAILHAVGEHP